MLIRGNGYAPEEFQFTNNDGLPAVVIDLTNLKWDQYQYSILSQLREDNILDVEQVSEKITISAKKNSDIKESSEAIVKKIRELAQKFNETKLISKTELDKLSKSLDELPSIIEKQSIHALTHDYYVTTPERDWYFDGDRELIMISLPFKLTFDIHRTINRILTSHPEFRKLQSEENGDTYCPQGGDFITLSGKNVIKQTEVLINILSENRIFHEVTSKLLQEKLKAFEKRRENWVKETEEQAKAAAKKDESKTLPPSPGNSEATTAISPAKEATIQSQPIKPISDKYPKWKKSKEGWIRLSYEFKLPHDFNLIPFATPKLPKGIDPAKFQYKSIVFDSDLFKQLSEQIKKEFIENNKFAFINHAKDLRLLNLQIVLSKEGTIRILYKDKEQMHEEMLLEKNPIAEALFKHVSKQKDFVQSLPVLEKLAKTRKQSRKKTDAKVDSASIGKESRLKKRGKYKHEYPKYKDEKNYWGFLATYRWARMYERIQKILKDKELSTRLSPEVVKSLKFFVNQYLERVASFNSPQAYEVQGSISPSSLSYYGYFRQSNIENSIIKVLADTLPNYSFKSVSDCDQFCQKFIAYQNAAVCRISINDSLDVIKQKISATSRKPGESLMILAEIPPETFNDQVAIAHLNEINTVFNLSDTGFLGYGKKDGHNYIYGNYNVSSFVERYGFAPTLQQAARIIADEASLDRYSSDYLSFAATQNDLRTGTLLVKDFSDLLENATYKQFKKMVNDDSNFSLKLLSDNICKYIDGFKKYKVDEMFAKNGLTTLLQDTYAQILNFMEIMMSIDFKNDNKAKFILGDYSTLIFENLNLWLELCADKNEAKQELGLQLRDKVMKSAPIKPAVTGFVNTGVKCMKSILSACADTKTQLNSAQASSKLEIIGYEDSYYEIVESLTREKGLIVWSPDYEQSLKNKIAEFQKSTPPRKLDILFVDPQGSMQRDDYTVTSHDVGAIIETLLKSQPEVTNKPLTIAMDLTIGKIDDLTMANLVEKYKSKIESGDLNLVCYRSIQKFDQFGLDKISGGYYQVYSNNPTLIENFQKVTAADEKDVDPINVKVLNHLYQNCAEGLDLYRARMFETTNRVYNQIDKSCLTSLRGKGKPEPPISIDERKDANNYFITLRSLKEKPSKHGMPRKMNLIESFLDNIWDFKMINRPSFGFPYTTTCPMDGAKEYETVRISFGIEDKEQIDKFLNQFNQYLRSEYLYPIILIPPIKEIIKENCPWLPRSNVDYSASSLSRVILDLLNQHNMDSTELNRFLPNVLSPVIAKLKSNVHLSILDMETVLTPLTQLYSILKNIDDKEMHLITEVYLGNKLNIADYVKSDQNEFNKFMSTLLDKVISVAKESPSSEILSVVNAMQKLTMTDPAPKPALEGKVTESVKPLRKLSIFINTNLSSATQASNQPSIPKATDTEQIERKKP